MKIIGANYRNYPRSFYRGDNRGQSLLVIKISGKGSRRLYFAPGNDLQRYAYFNHCGGRVYVTFRAYKALQQFAKRQDWL